MIVIDSSFVFGSKSSGSANDEPIRLPTSLPATPGQLWNNGGVIPIS
jgi:hypothetical protein